MHETDPAKIVSDGYNRIAHRFAQWMAEEVVDEPRARYLETLLSLLPDGSRVLDLGCGGGGPTTRALVRHYRYTGVDISSGQIRLARQNIPNGVFVEGDMTRMDFPPGSFDGIAAFYSLTHLPQGELPGLLRKIARWLAPGGVFLASLSSGHNPGEFDPNWLGAPMYFSGYSPDENTEFIKAAGLSLRTAQIETIYENGKPIHFFWVVTQKLNSDL